MFRLRGGVCFSKSKPLPCLLTFAFPVLCSLSSSKRFGLGLLRALCCGVFCRNFPLGRLAGQNHSHDDRDDRSERLRNRRHCLNPGSQELLLLELSGRVCGGLGAHLRNPLTVNVVIRHALFFAARLAARFAFFCSFFQRRSSWFCQTTRSEACRKLV